MNLIPFVILIGFVGLELLCYYTITYPKDQKLSSRQGPFQCVIVNNSSKKLIQKISGGSRESKKRDRVYEFMADIDMIIDENGYSNGILVPDNFPINGTLKTRESAILKRQCEGKQKCQKRLENKWQIGSFHRCFYRPHDKPVFWKNRKRTYKQQSNMYLYISLPLVVSILLISELDYGTDMIIPMNTR